MIVDGPDRGARRRAVRMAQEKFGASERFACKVLGQNRSALRKPYLSGTTVTPSLSGRVTSDTATGSVTSTSGYAWTYGYDTAGRLTTASLAAKGSRPTVANMYTFTGSPPSGCPVGSVANPGANTNRVASTTSIGGTASSAGYCVDGADRLLATTETTAKTYSYDGHGNVTVVTDSAGTTVFVYDAADRHVKTVAPNGSGGTVTILYKRDGTDRITGRTVTGSATSSSENGTFASGYTADGDAPDLDLSASGAITTRTLSLAGGVTCTKNYTDSSKSRWFYLNVHGDNISTAKPDGTAIGQVVAYDAYGTPIAGTGALDADAGPDTNPGSLDAGNLGLHQRFGEHAAGLNYIEMGARVYDPSTGRFMGVDPVEGGSANDYDYVASDSLNQTDLTGNCLWCVAIAARAAIALLTATKMKPIYHKNMNRPSLMHTPLPVTDRLVDTGLSVVARFVLEWWSPAEAVH